MISCPNCTSEKYTLTKDPEVSHCQKCNHYIFNELINREILLTHELVGDYQQKTREKQFKKVFNFILNKIDSPNFLEIGAGFGGYINYANTLGFDCLAVDIDDHYKDSYATAGIEFIQQDGNQLTLDVSSNVVILSHIIEHIIEPKKILNYLSNSNVKYFIIEVPSSKGTIFKISKFFLKLNIDFIWNRLWQKNSNSPHLHYFSDKSLLKTLNDCNLIVEKTINSRFATFKGSFERTLTTENFFTSIISVVVIQFLEFINFIMQTPENKIFIVKNLKYKPN